MNDDVIVPGWPTPKGYSNGRIGRGRVLHTGGQIGWVAGEGGRMTFPTSDLVGQFATTLDNILAVVRAAGGDVADIASMTVFVTDKDGAVNKQTLVVNVS